MTRGHIINLVSNDVQQLDQAVCSLPNLILAPFGFLVGNAVLYHFIGWPTLLGTAYLLVVFVYQGFGSRLASKLRQRAVVLADKRILKIINEIIRGIRTIKICSWEKHFGNLVSLLRGPVDILLVFTCLTL